MTPEDVKFIDDKVNEFRNLLLKVPYLDRANNTQRRGLASAFSIILSLPALVRERVQAQAEGEQL